MEARRRTATFAISLLALVLTGAPVAGAGGAIHQDTGVYHFEDGTHAGNASLTRNGSGVSIHLGTTIGGKLFDFATPLDGDWESGDATTVWIVVFNHPDNCIDGCGEDEVIAALGDNNRAGVGVHYGTGHVAHGTTFHAAANLKVGDSDGVLFGEALHHPSSAEIHLVIRSHGPAADLEGEELAAALHSVDGGCATNLCGDPQFAVFPAP